MSEKLKVGFLLLGGCAGCEMAVVDLSEKLVDALAHLEVVFWAPTVADVKYHDLEAMDDGYIDVAFIDGMIRLDEHIHMAKVMRKKAKTLIAFGVCAALGGTAGMGSLHTKEELFSKAFKNTTTTDNPDNVYPSPHCLVDGKYDLTLPAYEDKVRTLNQIVDVDYYIGGCPPHHSHVEVAIGALVTKQLPPKGSWITNGKAVCDVCKRNPTRNGNGGRIMVDKVLRMVDGIPDDNVCLLQQGYLCFGPITQGDCGGSCLNVNIPCRGCGGPIPGNEDYGAQALTSIASILGSEDATASLMEKYPNLAKFFYRYALPSGTLPRKM
ncbi:MAG: F420-nonreducing hydrogenase [Desulfobulbaceae bacterium]|jgi:F420-non-reducing hydrogenase small subunit|nr:F420-nonreducing hydrogenase [Desulfobulbaceae bacterium]